MKIDKGKSKDLIPFNELCPGDVFVHPDISNCPVYMKIVDCKRDRYKDMVFQSVCLKTGSLFTTDGDTNCLRLDATTVIETIN